MIAGSLTILNFASLQDNESGGSSVEETSVHISVEEKAGDADAQARS